MNKVLRIIALGLIGFSLNSCEDFLDVESENQSVLTEFYQSESDCRAATGALYNRPWYPFNSRFYFIVGDARANNQFVDQMTNPGAILNRLVDNSSTIGVEDGWDSFYSVIGQADLVLKYIDQALSHGVDASVVNACKGEARFMRGVAYWYLTCTWGDVPIVEDPEALSKNYVVNTNFQEDVLQYAIKDLEFAADNLPLTDEPGRVTRYSALGMLSRLYITAACYARGNNFSTDRYPLTAQDYYEKAKEAARIVCEQSPNELMNDYEQLFRVQNNNNSESLFALQWVPGSTTYGVGNAIQARLNKYSDIMDGDHAWGGNEYISGELVELMHNRGELSRKRGVMFFTGAKYDYLGANTKEGSFTVPTVKTCPIKKHIVGSSKDTGVQSVSQNSGMATPMLRLAEVYLLYAEAILGMQQSTQDADALKYFNKVRTRAGLAEVSQITLQDIWDERRCELAMEGQFWYDIVRRGYWDTDWVVNFMKNQNRGVRYDYSNPQKFVWGSSDGRESKVPDASCLKLVYPLNEETLNPLLNEPPVHYDVK
ncbi:RagB/SusD family nutrient uptake outer membrane protein [uncultured Bacteroides sp.]|uniref:RagB/SusD family nutrient uptake outer membrane protein n=1 Tax=uncultured Bacteroides sp. TaxID=162156 RepID=UPI0026225156|nr:RagB/SusD family nutrient uptake outer membrane protein [uncultured Bacteroides sp.]